jgi:hypothetical protein
VILHRHMAYYRLVPSTAAAAASIGTSSLYDGLFLEGGVATEGPWSSKLQHGGPPSALLARAVERAGAAVGLPFVSRLTVLFFRPVKVAALLSVEVTPVRVGSKAAHFTASLFEHASENPAEGSPLRKVELLRATGLSTRFAPVSKAQSPPSSLHLPAPPLPDDASQASSRQTRFSENAAFGYINSLDTHVAVGSHGEGPTFVWARANVPLVQGDTSVASPLERTMLWADSAGGMSYYVDFATTSFVNADMTVNLIRPAEGEWIGMRARTDLCPELGQGLASGELYDRVGFFGRVSQQQILESRL